MSREEAIEIINRENDPNDTKVWEVFPEYREALDMAIQALSQEPKTQMVDKSNFDIEQYKMDLQGAYDCGFEAGKKAEQELCTDVVSRQAVFDCATLITSIPTEDWDIGDWVCLFRDRVSQLPSVNPQYTGNEFFNFDAPIVKKSMEQDAISREDALKLIYDFKEKHTEDREKHPINYGTLLDLIRLIRELPSVTQKSGKWIKHDDGAWWECSECHSERAYGNEYCPDCGSHNGDIAKMEREDNNESCDKP